MAERSPHGILERRLHKLSADAKSDSRSLDDADEVPIWWAAPIDRLNDPGTFWAFFPTLTTSLLARYSQRPVGRPTRIVRTSCPGFTITS